MSARRSISRLARMSVMALGLFACGRRDPATRTGAAAVTGEAAASARDSAPDAERWAARFSRMDTNNDGAITLDEAGERRWSFVSRADADHDARVTRAELDAARTAGLLGLREHRRGEGHEGRGPRRSAPDPTRWVAAFDQNGDGALQVAELPERMRARWSAADRNADGVLSVDELSVDRVPTAPQPTRQPE